MHSAGRMAIKISFKLDGKKWKKKRRGIQQQQQKIGFLYCKFCQVVFEFLGKEESVCLKVLSILLGSLGLYIHLWISDAEFHCWEKMKPWTKGQKCFILVPPPINWWWLSGARMEKTYERETELTKKRSYICYKCGR